MDPRTWEYSGNWKVELDENGSSVLTVTDSNLGGLALPCLSWADYEVRFDMRIIESQAGWIIRASRLNDYVLQKLDLEKITTLYRVSGLLPTLGKLDHNLSIESGK